VSYWTAKADLKFMGKFRADMNEMWALEDKYDEAERARNFRDLSDPPDVKDDPDYQEVRERVAKGMTRAIDIAYRLKVPVGIVSTPPPVIAGSSPVIRTTMFDVILTDRTYRRIPRQEIKDDLNRTVGVAEDEVRAEWRHVWNPLWWLLHGPFLLLRSAGLNTEKVERQWWSRVAVQLGIDLAVGVVALLILRAFGVGT
jgi:hypothetical protein